MGKSLSDLGLKDEQLPTAGQALDDLPTFGTFAPPPQPGPFRFKLPGDLTTIWDTFEAEGKGTRVTAVFDANAPLVITQSKGGKYNGEPFQTRLNNNERARGKDKKLASDLDYLIAALEGPQAKRPTSNREYIQRVVALRGKEFGADIRWSWRCSKDRVIRVRDAQGQLIEAPDGKKGCGETYYQEDVQPLATGEYALEAGCTCGAVLRAFGNLDNIRA